jgi:hypothetical protein
VHIYKFDSELQIRIDFHLDIYFVECAHHHVHIDWSMIFDMKFHFVDVLVYGRL